MGLSKKLENQIKSESKKYLKNGRPDFDIPHTLCAVYWMKQLLKTEKGDKKILITTMYLHDIGYSNLFKKNHGFNDVKKVKSLHMKRGALFSKKILKNLSFKESEIKKISHLVRIHDELEKISTSDEVLVMEADSLSALDRKRVPSNFNKKDYAMWLNDFETKRAPRFKTKTGKKHMKKLMKYAKSYY